jgi:hypothetical protein
MATDQRQKSKSPNCRLVVYWVVVVALLLVATLFVTSFTNSCVSRRCRSVTNNDHTTTHPRWAAPIVRSPSFRLY